MDIFYHDDDDYLVLTDWLHSAIRYANATVAIMLATVCDELLGIRTPAFFSLIMRHLNFVCELAQLGIKRYLMAQLRRIDIPTVGFMTTEFIVSHLLLNSVHCVLLFLEGELKVEFECLAAF